MYNGEMILSEVVYWKCVGCGYEFLSNAKTPTCPRCKGDKLEKKDFRKLAGFGE